MRHRRLQVIRHDHLRRPSVEVEGVLAGVDEVFLLLARHGFDIRELGARKDGDEHFHRNLLSGIPVSQVQPVPGEVHVHPVPCLVFQVSHGRRLNQVRPQDAAEAAARIPLREILEVLLVHFEFRHSPFAEHPGILRHLGHRFVIAGRMGLVAGRVLLEESHELGFVHSEDILDGLTTHVEDGDVLFHGVP